MKKYLKIMISVTMAVILNFNIVFAAEVTPGNSISMEDRKARFEAMMNHIMSVYDGSDDITYDVLYDAAMKGMFGALDKYSKYFTDEEYEEYIKDEEGVFYGIGAVISFVENNPTIINVYEDSPAEKAGVMKDDVLKEVDGKSVEGMTLEEVSNIVKGEEGKEVVLKVSRMGDVVVIPVIRGLVKENPVTSNKISEIYPEETSNIAYLKISSFNSNLTEYVVPKIAEYIVDDVDGIIIDLRNNPGGYFTQALKFISLFLKKGDIITTMIDAKDNKEIYKNNMNGLTKNVVILINKSSASASELTTAALQENDRAIVVGENSYGKSVAQTIFPTQYGKYKLTTNEYLTPKDNSIKGVGVTPDIIIETPKYINDVKYKYFLNDSDEDVAKAKKMLNYLGYTITNFDEKFDDEMFLQVQRFQGDNGLGTYGGLDYTTQRQLNLKALEKANSKDEQLIKAIDVIKNYDNYKQSIIDKETK